jgi:hypothetical protein
MMQMMDVVVMTKPQIQHQCQDPDRRLILLLHQSTQPWRNKYNLTPLHLTNLRDV